MTMLEHTRVFTIKGADRETLDQKSDQLTEALIDMEEDHAELLDSAIFTDLGEAHIGATITVGHSGDYAKAVAHADELLLKAIRMLGDDFDGPHPGDHDPNVFVIENVKGPRSLAVA